MAFVLSLSDPQFSFFGCLGKAVLPHYGIYFFFRYSFVHLYFCRNVRASKVRGFSVFIIGVNMTFDHSDLYIQNCLLKVLGLSWLNSAVVSLYYEQNCASCILIILYCLHHYSNIRFEESWCADYISYFLWDHWAHSGLFENQIRFKSVFEGVGAYAASQITLLHMKRLNKTEFPIFEFCFQRQPFMSEKPEEKHVRTRKMPCAA